MNRQYKRMMAKEEAAKKKGTPRPNPKAAALAGQKKERTKPRQFLKEVLAELRKVAWPSRQEVVAYSVVVLVSVIVIATLIFFMDLLFTQAVLTLYGVE